MATEMQPKASALSPPDVPLYPVLKAMLKRRGYGLILRSTYWSAEVQMLYAVRRRPTKGGKRRPQHLDLRLSLPELESMPRFQSQAEIMAILRSRIDQQCARGQRHIQCICGQALLLEVRRYTTTTFASHESMSLYRDASTGPNGTVLSLCPACQEAIVAARVREINDGEDDAEVVP